jgi:hypothetical protein
MTGIWSLSKEKANYRPASAPELRCDDCKFMFPRIGLGGCRLVRGIIRSSDTCDHFSSRHAAESNGPQS